MNKCLYFQTPHVGFHFLNYFCILLTYMHLAYFLLNTEIPWFNYLFYHLDYITVRVTLYCLWVWKLQIAFLQFMASFVGILFHCLKFTAHNGLSLCPLTCHCDAPTEMHWTCQERIWGHDKVWYVLHIFIATVFKNYKVTGLFPKRSLGF